MLENQYYCHSCEQWHPAEEFQFFVKKGDYKLIVIPRAVCIKAEELGRDLKALYRDELVFEKNSGYHPPTFYRYCKVVKLSFFRRYSDQLRYIREISPIAS